MSRLFDIRHQRLLLDLLDINTVSPMESGLACDSYRAQQIFAEAASASGFEVVMHGAPPSTVISERGVPLSVVERHRQMGSEFLASQTNLVVRLGPPRHPDRTLMLNFHTDTVAGFWPVTLEEDRFIGRGSVDCKGPGVALLAGIAEALRLNPDLPDVITILIQCVSGEEGGAMGVYGTKHLIELGYVGRLNVFAEPSGGGYFDFGTSSMTLRIRVDGHGATDDAPHTGVNATVILSLIATALVEDLGEWIATEGGRLCVAGIHTGRMHNRVYGRGELHANFAYGSMELAAEISRRVDQVIKHVHGRFNRRFAGVRDMRATMEALPDVLVIEWTKRDLPVLSNRDEVMESMLERAGIRRWSEKDADKTFTCDAIWVPRDAGYTIVYGPGDLAANNAHADNEYVMLDDLENYARGISELVGSFARQAS